MPKTSSLSNIHDELTSLINLSNEVLSSIQLSDLDLIQLNDAQILRDTKLKAFFNQYDRSTLISSIDEVIVEKLNELQAIDGDIMSAINVKKDTLSKQIIVQKNNKKATTIYNKNK